jgi:hypothetical protein
MSDFPCKRCKQTAETQADQDYQDMLDEFIDANEEARDGNRDPELNDTDQDS